MSTPRLPAGWRKTSINELVGDSGLFSDGDWVESKDQDADGDVRLVQLADVGSGIFLDKSARSLTSTKAAQLKCTYLEAGDLLVSRMGEPLTRACIYPGGPRPAVSAVDIAIVRLPGDPVATQCLMHAINSDEFSRRADMLAGGATRQRISRTKLGAIEINWPSEEDRRRIVTRIRDAMERVEEMERLVLQADQELARLRTSFVGELCEELMAQSTHHPFSAIKRSARVGLVRAKDEQGDGRRWGYLKMDNLGRRGELVLRRYVRVDATETEVETFTLQPGDFLFNTRNSAELVGKTAVVETLPEPMLFNNNILRVRFSEGIDPRFVNLAFQTRFVRQQLEQRKMKTTSVAAIYQRDLDEVLVPLPSLDVQRSVVEKFERLEEARSAMLRAIAGRAAEASAMRQAILRQAFSGKL